MPDSNEGEQAVAGSGEQERALADSTNGGRPLLRSLDYPCTARLRLRRLVAYHWRYSDWEIYDAYALLIFLDSPSPRLPLAILHKIALAHFGSSIILSTTGCFFPLKFGKMKRHTEILHRQAHGYDQVPDSYDHLIRSQVHGYDLTSMKINSCP